MAEPTGLEPATSRVTGEHSNQLNYGSIFGWVAEFLFVNRLVEIYQRDFFGKGTGLIFYLFLSQPCWFLVSRSVVLCR